MKKLLLVFGTVFIVVVGIGAGLYFGGYLKGPEIRAVRMSWAEVTAGEMRVTGEVIIDNRLPVGLGSSNVGLNVPVDFYQIPAFTLAVPELRLEKGESTLAIEGTLRQAELPRWWPQFVNNEEVLLLRVRPKVHADILGRRIIVELPSIEARVPIPLLRDVGSAEARTMGFDHTPLLEIARSPKEHFRVHPPDHQPARPVLTIVSWELHWGVVTQATTQILGTMILRNEMDLPLPVQSLGLGIDMNGIQVVPDIRVTPDRPELPPGQSVPLKLDAQVDNAKLVEWWSSHLQQGEETILTARVGLTIVVPLLNDLELPLLPVPGFRCIIKTDIMGTANYEIAKAIGTEAGQEPKAASVNCPAPVIPILEDRKDGEPVSVPTPEVPTPPGGEVPGTLPEATLPPLPTDTPALPTQQRISLTPARTPSLPQALGLTPTLSPPPAPSPPTLIVTTTSTPATKSLATATPLPAAPIVTPTAMPTPRPRPAPTPSPSPTSTALYANSYFRAYRYAHSWAKARPYSQPKSSTHGYLHSNSYFRAYRYTNTHANPNILSERFR